MKLYENNEFDDDINHQIIIITFELRSHESKLKSCQCPQQRQGGAWMVIQHTLLRQFSLCSPHKVSKKTAKKNAIT